MKNFQQLKLLASFMPVVSAVSGTSDYRLPSLRCRHRIPDRWRIRAGWAVLTKSQQWPCWWTLFAFGA